MRSPLRSIRKSLAVITILSASLVLMPVGASAVSAATSSIGVCKPPVGYFCYYMYVGNPGTGTGPDMTPVYPFDSFTIDTAAGVKSGTVTGPDGAAIDWTSYPPPNPNKPSGYMVANTASLNGTPIYSLTGNVADREMIPDPPNDSDSPYNVYLTCMYYFTDAAHSSGSARYLYWNVDTSSVGKKGEWTNVPAAATTSYCITQNPPAS